jgi:hypothetical protein
MSELASVFRAKLRDAIVADKAIDGALLKSVLDSVVIDATLKVLRPADLVVLKIKLVNIRRRDGKFERRDPDKPARLVVEHQPQSFGEEAFIETADQSAMDDGNVPLTGNKDDDGTPKQPEAPVRANNEPTAPSRLVMAGPSRVAHVMPAGVVSIPATLAGLLSAMQDWPLALHTNAVADVSGWVTSTLGSLGALAKASAGTRIPDRDWRVIDEAIGSIVRKTMANARRGTAPSYPAIDAELKKVALRAVPRRRGEDADIVADRAAAKIYAEAKLASDWAATVENEPALQAAGAALGLVDNGPFEILRKPRPPGEGVTAIEMPFRLLASPLPGAAFAHAKAPVTHEGRTEIWHSRLGSRVVERRGVSHIDDRAGRMGKAGWEGEKLRFLWSPDVNNESGFNPFNMPLTASDRRMLVQLTTGFDEKKPGGAAFNPRGAYVTRLMLTALGGDLEAQRSWDLRPAGVDLSSWTHRAATGRDYFVRVEYSGFLFPFRHRASLIKVTERKFQSEGGKRVARLRQRFFIVVRDRIMQYPAAAPNPSDGREHPFVSIECLTDVTPNLGEPGKNPDHRVKTENFYTSTSPDADLRMAFWPAVEIGGQTSLLLFKFMGVDRAGRRIPFELPIMFVSEVQNVEDRLNLIIEDYNVANASSRTIFPGGRTVRLAPAGSDGDDVDYPVSELLYEARPLVGGISSIQSDTLQAFPIIASGIAQLQALEALTGHRHNARFEWDNAYRQGNVAAGGGALFARFRDSERLNFGAGGVSADKAGAIANPNLLPSGLSSKYGIASGEPDTFALGKFNPDDFLPDANLLGIFNLRTLLTPGLDLSDAQAPKITKLELDSPPRIETRMELRHNILAGRKDFGLIIDSDSWLTLSTKAIVPIGGDAKPSHLVEGTLTNFRIDLAGAIILRFDRLRFWQEDGRKPDIDVDLHPIYGVTFGEPLNFIDKMQKYIPANGFSDPPDLQVTPNGLTVNYAIGLPPMEIGVLSISNVLLGATFSLPFTGGPPTIRFNFAERHNCFNMTVSLLGGGGFVAIIVAADGIKELEVQLDFGARVAIDLGVASGLVYYKGGFYFHYTGDELLFEGFVELGGRLTLLGLISLSLTFHLGLCYESLQLSDKADGAPRSQTRLFGQASLTVEVELLLYSESVTIRVEKTFIGSEADPTFVQLIETPAVWAEYCDAFA